MNELAYLKSGTDIRGTAVSVNGASVDLTDERVAAITVSFVCFLRKKLGKESLSVAVGYDSRVSSPRIASAVEKTLAANGVKVYSCGLSTTPSMFMSIINFGVDASVEITASHLPYEMNGLKYFTREGGFSGSEIAEILEYASLNPCTVPDAAADFEKLDNMARYCADLRNMIIAGANRGEKPLAGLKIAVDAGNGVGGFYADNVLAPLGADVSGSCFLEPDGMFPNHIPNPENADAMRAVSGAVVASKSDLGIIFDTDCDRAACVGKSGEEINRNKLVALASFIALKNCAGGTVVTDSVTSDGLAEFITEKLGGVHHRFKRGYKNVIDEAKRLSGEGTAAPLAIETSGHAAFSENYYLDDGAYLVTKIIIEAAKLAADGKIIEDIISDLKTPVEEKEIRYKILVDDFAQYGNDVIADFEKHCRECENATVSPVNHEGIRVNFGKDSGDGWILLRRSLHEPLLVMNAESNTAGGVRTMLLWFKDFVAGYGKLDISKLEAAL